MMRPHDVGCPKTVPDVNCRANKTANASSQEEKCMAALNAEPVLEKNLDLEPGRFGAKLTTVEVAKHLKVHPSMVCKMAKRGELPGFKIGSAWRFDHGQIEEWMRSRMHGIEG
jgi:excisionase family DNA binding protein